MEGESDIGDYNVNIGSLNNIKKEEDSLIPSEPEEEYVPIQKNSELFKYILYTTKIENKFNSFINLLYNTSICEIGFWIMGFFLFIASPSNLYLIWVLIVHPFKGILGLVLLTAMPKTYDIIENVGQNPNFSQNKIVELIKTQIKESFIANWEINKNKFFIYVIFTAVCIVIDFIICLVQVFKFGNKDEWILRQTCILVIILVFIISDFVYFLWFFTLSFSLPKEMIDPVKSAFLGSVTELKTYAISKIKRNPIENH